jgi:hypothetical protein
MSFHLILPSNACPKLFPANSGSKYSTAIHDTISLPGRWEVALMGITCSNCVNTFHNDSITIEEKRVKQQRDIRLHPQIFRHVDKAIEYVNRCVSNPDVHFSVTAKNCVTLSIKSRDVTVTFGETLGSIFAFTKNSFSGVGEYTAEGEFSLTRCIDFLYIYSNITDYVRVGDTKAPLLGIVTLKSTGKECNQLTEHLIDNPTYVSLITNNISEINIGIYDGAGEMIPFGADAITVIRLHFRHVQ